MDWPLTSSIFTRACREKWLGSCPRCWMEVACMGSCIPVFQFYLFIYFNWRLVTLQYCGGFCRTLTLISHGCTCVTHPKLPSHLSPLPIPLGCPSALALSALFHASNLDWSSISHIVIYMFHSSSLKSSCPPLLP